MAADRREGPPHPLVEILFPSFESRYTPIAAANHNSGPLQPLRLAACTFGHAISDGLANFVPPLWFTVQSVYRLADRDIGLISLLFSLATNFSQPIFGYIVDRWRLRNLIPFALTIAVVFMCVIGFAPKLWVFVACLMLAGLGIALFHPRGGALAAESSGSRRAFGMSIFGAGGAIGYALASLVSPLLHNFGLHLGFQPLQGLIFALPLGLIAVALLWRYNPQGPAVFDCRAGARTPPETPTKEPTPGGVQAPALQPETAPAREIFSLRRHLLPHLGSLAPLLVVMVLRSGTVSAYATFIQILQGRLGHSSFFQGLVLFIFVAGAAIGGMVGGHLSDLYGRRFITVTSLLLCPPLLYYALYTPAPMVLVLLFAAGFTLRGAESVNIAQTQDLLPHGMSTASAISMGFTWGLAGLVPPLVGLLSDRTGSLKLALAATVLLPVIAAIVALALPTAPPAPGRHHPVEELAVPDGVQQSQL